MRIEEKTRHIIDIEESDNIDWNMVKNICDSEIAYINENGFTGQVDNILYRFLEDYDIRQKDEKYGEWQRGEVKRFLGAT